MMLTVDRARLSRKHGRNRIHRNGRH